MAEQRPQDSLTSVLLPSGQHGQECLSVARSWAREGLLKRALWIPTENVQPSAFGGMQANGILLDPGQEKSLDALTVLSRSRLRTLTVVILQICDPDKPVDDAQLDAAALLEAALRSARPQALVPADATDPVEVFLVNLLTGPTGLAGVPFDQVTGRSFDVNLVASPEDRRAADQMDRFVRPADNLDSWAMAQCATAGGLWSGMQLGPWEIIRGRGEDSALSQGDFVQPLRGFTRIVTSAPTARRALATAMNELRFAPENILMANHLVPVSDPQPYIDRTLEAFDHVDGGRIRYATPTPTPSPDKQRVGFFGALGEFFGFSAREIAKVPVFVFRRTKARVSARTTATLSGGDGHMVVYAGGESPDLDVYLADFERQSIEAQYTLADMEGGVPPAAPELWRTLRATSFGLLDGSAIPEPIPTPIVADQRVVLPSTTLVAPPPVAWRPDPEAPYPLTQQAGMEGLEVPPTSPRDAQWVNALITELWQRTSADIEQLQTARHEAAEQLKAYEAFMAAQAAAAGAAGSDAALSDAAASEAAGANAEGASGDAPDAAGSDAARSVSGTSGEEADPQPDSKGDDAPHESHSRADDEHHVDSSDDHADTDAEVDRSSPEAQAPIEADSQADEPESVVPPAVDPDLLDIELDAARVRLDTLQREYTSLERWVADREHSLLWRLAATVQSRTVQASTDAAQFRELATQIPVIDSEEPRRARNKFANRFLFLLSFGVLLALLTWRFGDRLMGLVGLAGWVAWVIYAVIVVVWLVVLLISYYRRRSRFIAQLRLLRHQQRDAVRQCREATYAEQKLTGLFQQLVEWGEMIGYAIHDPWQPEDKWLSGRLDADLAASLPTCVDLAVPDPNDVKGFRRLKREAMTTLAGEGWRSRTFNVLLERMLAEQDLEDSAEVAAQLDMDSPATPNGTRRTMLEQLRSGTLQSSAAERIMRQKAAGLYADRTTLARHAVVPVNSEYAAEDTDLLDAGSDLELMRPQWGDFLSGVLAGRTQFSLNLWSDEGTTHRDNRSHMHTLAFAPPRMSGDLQGGDIEIVPTRAADENGGVELSARCDFGPAVERQHVRIFAHTSQQMSGFEAASGYSMNGQSGSDNGRAAQADPTAGRSAPSRVTAVDVDLYN